MAEPIKKFRPHVAVQILLDLQQPAFLKTWALGSLLVWAVLDQAPGVGSRKKNERDQVRRKIRTYNAKRAGIFILAYILDQRLKRIDYGIDRDLLPIINLFNDLGGLYSCVDSYGAHGLLDDLNGDVIKREVYYVYAICEYLCRYEKWHENKDKTFFTVKMAQEFIRKCAPDGDKTYDSSKLEQTWLEYKHAAPYIYAFYPCYEFIFRYIKSHEQRSEQVEIADVFNFIQRVTSNQRILTRWIGQAAHIANILDSTNVRDVRITDFKGSPISAPFIRPFSDEERTLLNNFDPRSALA